MRLFVLVLVILYYCSIVMLASILLIPRFLINILRYSWEYADIILEDQKNQINKYINE